MKYRLIQADQLARRYIRLARETCRGTFGYDRAMKLCHFFKMQGHCKTESRFEDLLNTRRIDRRFNSDLMKTLAQDLADKNEGFVFNSIEGIWICDSTLQTIFFEHALVCKYSSISVATKSILITKERYHDVLGYKLFTDQEYLEWLDKLKHEATSDLEYLRCLANELSLA